MLQDLKYAVRSLINAKGWTAVVLLSLALGIGANMALFTAVNGVLLRTLTVPEPESLIRLGWFGQNDMMRSSSDYGSLRQVNGQNARSTFSFEMFRELRTASETVADLFAAAPSGSLNVVANGSAEIASGLLVSGDYFGVLRVPALIGRALSAEDDQPSAAAVAVIGEGYWRSRFAADPGVLGRTVIINNEPVTIVGVMPQAFTGTQRLGAAAPDVTLPMALDARVNLEPTRMSQGTYWWVQVMGRLKPGATAAQVHARLETVFQGKARAGMDSYMNGLTADERGLSDNAKRGTAVPHLFATSGRRGSYDLDQGAARSAQMLTVVVVLILLIVCANVANLLLSRATMRKKEISVRLAMGATRGRLIRQLLTESVLLSSIGGLAGALVGYWARGLLTFGQSAPVDWHVLAFAVALSVLTGIVFGLAPALRATHADLAGAMKEQSRSVVRARSWSSRVLLVAQVAMSLVLLVGAGLFLRTLQNLQAVDVGFNADNLLAFRLNPYLNRYDGDRTLQTYQHMEDAIRVIPGVSSLALTQTMFLSGSTSSSSVYAQGKPEDRNVYMMRVSPSFFETLQISVVRGRPFAPRDDKTGPPVVILNETAAKLLFPADGAIGRRVGFSPEKDAEFEVVGVVRDSKYANLREPAPPTMYRSYLQGSTRGMTFLIRTAVDPNTLIPTVRSTVNRVDSSLPITNMTTQMAQIAGRVTQERLFAVAYASFGALALLLASIGLFGVMSYSVARRTNEIGVRVALGAQRTDIIRMVLGESLLLVAIGIAIGLAGALASGRLVAATLFGLSPTDVATFGAAVVLMVLVSALAGYLPARRAALVDPLVALHTE